MEVLRNSFLSAITKFGSQASFASLGFVQVTGLLLPIGLEFALARRSEFAVGFRPIIEFPFIDGKSEPRIRLQGEEDSGENSGRGCWT